MFYHRQVNLKEADEVTVHLQSFPADPALSVCSGCPRPCADTPGPQPQPMDLRVGQRPPVEPPPEPTLLALQHPQRLHHHLFLAGLQTQRSAETMRVKIELPMHAAASSSDPAPLPPFSLPRPSPPSPTPRPSPGGRPSPQLSMDAPLPESQVGQQEQELRQLLNKDKSKRSKRGGLPSRCPRPPSWARERGVPAGAPLCLLGAACESGWG